MLVGFFMTLIDWTAVFVANPSIMAALNADYESVVWVTSAYLLGFAVPLLMAGRLGDRFGPKNLYLIGLAIFTAGSLWCGLSGSIEVLVAARVAQSSLPRAPSCCCAGRLRHRGGRPARGVSPDGRQRDLHRRCADSR
jgi:MFS family permease